MSVRRDWEFYLSGNFVTYKEGERELPFYVEGVRGGEDGREDLMFSGRKVTSASRTTQANLSWEEITTEGNVRYPKPGYIKVGSNDPIYLRYRPVRNRYKGLTSCKIANQRFSLNFKAAHAIWVPEFTGRIDHDLYFDGKAIWFMDISIGSVKDSLILSAEGEFLRPKIEEYLNASS